MESVFEITIEKEVCFYKGVSSSFARKGRGKVRHECKGKLTLCVKCSKICCNLHSSQCNEDGCSFKICKKCDEVNRDMDRHSLKDYQECKECAELWCPNHHFTQYECFTCVAYYKIRREKYKKRRGNGGLGIRGEEAIGCEICLEKCFNCQNYNCFTHECCACLSCKNYCCEKDNCTCDDTDDDEETKEIKKRNRDDNEL